MVSLTGEFSVVNAMDLLSQGSASGRKAKTLKIFRLEFKSEFYLSAII